MMQLPIFLIYNFVALPIIYIAVHFAAIFNKKLRHGVWVRHFQWKRVKLQPEKSCILFHTASLGEYEHIRPLFPNMKKNCPKPKFLVNMFFSPSGYLNANIKDGPDQYIYAPFDTPWAVWRLYHRLKPKALVIAKHDIWPNQVWIARKMGIPVILINASLGKRSSRLQWWSRGFHKELYKNVKTVFTISPADRDNLKRLVSADKIVLSGDTKFDQVVNRKENAENLELLPTAFYKDHFVFVAGSIWPADMAVIVPGLLQLMKNYPLLRLVLVPHEPSEKHLGEIEANFPSTIRFSKLENYHNEQTIAVDKIGILASLYKNGKIGFVGGGFKEGIHNVMEAAVYGIPVFYGPRISGSSEAEAMAQPHQGGTVVRDADDFLNKLTQMLKNEELIKQAGQEANNFVLARTGASNKISAEICDLI